jgi:hypothetical protein
MSTRRSPLTSQTSRVVALAATLGVTLGVALPSQAAEFLDYRAYTGAACSSDGSSTVSDAGTRVNTSTVSRDATYQTFHCPLSLAGYFTDANRQPPSLIVNVFALGPSPTAAANGESSCKLVVTPTGSGGSVLQQTLAIAANGSSTPQQLSFLMTLPERPSNFVAFTLAPYTAHLRCRLMNSNVLPNAGIRSYSVSFVQQSS